MGATVSPLQASKSEAESDARPDGDELELTAIGNRACRHACGFGLIFKSHSDLFGALQGPADISIVRSAVERDQPVAVLAIRLESVADLLGPFPEDLRALRAFDFDFFFRHECPCLKAGILRCAVLRTGVRIC
jgi:hypothetical protein